MTIEKVQEVKMDYFANEMVGFMQFNVALAEERGEGQRYAMNLVHMSKSMTAFFEKHPHLNKTQLVNQFIKKELGSDAEKVYAMYKKAVKEGSFSFVPRIDWP